jgi:demethylmenaquinone methyltransferase/2-methoxy-6-polyprenyl-1,4-benzoquinol methylase
MFGEVAGRYDFLNHFLSMHVDRYWRWRTVRRAPPTGSGPVLDVCTGTADLALAYWRAIRRARSAGHGSGDRPTAVAVGDDDAVAVVGADFCQPMLQIARRKTAGAGAGEEVVLVEADTLRLPFPNDHFELVSVAFGLRNVADTDRGLAEMTRVCAPGGRVVVLEFSLPTRQPLRAIYGWYFNRALPRIGQLVSGSLGKAYNYLPESVNAFPAGAALGRRMEAAGLTDVTIDPLTGGIASLYVGRK